MTQLVGGPLCGLQIETRKRSVAISVSAAKAFRSAQAVELIEPDEADDAAIYKRVKGQQAKMFYEPMAERMKAREDG